MDRMVFIGALGARDAMLAQSVAANNLANASTTGFRADLARFETERLAGPGFDTRAFSTVAPTSLDLRPGSIEQTGRPLDVAIDGDGFIAVEAPDGGEAYTRAGDLRRGPGGMLVTGSGQPVLGEGGLIFLPPVSDVRVGTDGTISMVTPGDEGDVVVTMDRLRLVSGAGSDWVKGEDGLIRKADGQPADLDGSVRLVPGALEASNVSPVTELVKLIELARMYEIEVKVMNTAREMEQKSDTLVDMG